MFSLKVAITGGWIIVSLSIVICLPVIIMHIMYNHLPVVGLWRFHWIAKIMLFQKTLSDVVVLYDGSGFSLPPSDIIRILKVCV